MSHEPKKPHHTHEHPHEPPVPTPAPEPKPAGGGGWYRNGRWGAIGGVGMGLGTILIITLIVYLLGYRL